MKLTCAALHVGLLASTVLAQLGAPPSGCCATAAMLRFSCSRLVIERLDPLVNPGVIGSPHTHQVVGGDSFNATMKPVSYDPSNKSTCTSCTFSEDFSNYWTANLYFQARNGSFKRVPQMVNLGLEGNEGITVYYIPPYDGKTKVTAFTQVSSLEHDRYRSVWCLLGSPNPHSSGIPDAGGRRHATPSRRRAEADLPQVLQ